jgi:hypothetical protein
MRACILIRDLVRATSQTTSATSGNQTDLATRRAEAGLGRRVTNVLVVTTTVRVLDGVHCHTTNLRPRVTLGLVLVPRATGLEHRLVNAAATGNDANRAWKNKQDGYRAEQKDKQLKHERKIKRDSDMTWG